MAQQTPNLGLTYPEAGDHTRLWEHFQTLAEAVDGSQVAACLRSKTGTQSIPNATNTVVTHAATVYSAGGFTADGNGITVPHKGLYLVIGASAFSLGSGNLRYITVSGSTSGSLAQVRYQPLTNYQTTMRVQTVTPLVAGETVSLEVYQNSGGALDCGASVPGGNQLQVYLLARTA